MVGLLDGVLWSGWGKVVCGMVVMGLGAGSAMGAISLVETPVAIDSRLEAAGWMGIEVALVADATSGGVVGEDFMHNEIASFTYVNNHVSIIYTYTYVFGATEAIGISGPVHQAWTVNGGKETRTPTGAVNADGKATDSFFINAPTYFSVPNYFTEDNNLASGGDGTSFTTSPLQDTIDTDGDEVEYGVGSLMTFEALFLGSTAPVSTDLAFLIVPAGTSDVYARGAATDKSGNLFTYDQVLNPAGFGEGSETLTMQATFVVGTPEPGTVGVLGLGAVVLGRRRRGRS